MSLCSCLDATEYEGSSPFSAPQHYMVLSRTENGGFGLKKGNRPIPREGGEAKVWPSGSPQPGPFLFVSASFLHREQCCYQSCELNSTLSEVHRDEIVSSNCFGQARMHFNRSEKRPSRKPTRPSFVEILAATSNGPTGATLSGDNRALAVPRLR